MLGLTKATDYAILALGYLDQQEDATIISTKEIAETFAIPSELLAKVLQRLSKYGMVDAHQGRGGGYSLARPTESVTVTEVVEAVEGPITLTVCLREGGQVLCEQYNYCTIKSPVEAIQEMVIRLFGTISVASITTGAGLRARKQTIPTIPLRV